MPLFTKKKPKPVARGKFIVMDGTDGSGKTTQVALLLKSLQDSGYQAEHIKFPQYKMKSAGPTEEYLDGRYGKVKPQAASILYAVDRFDASFRMRQLLDEGKIIICDRYVLANAGHQGGKIPDRLERVKFYKWLDNLEYEIFGIPKPDLNFVLHIPTELRTKLMRRRATDTDHKTDMHEADPEHLKNAERVYLEISKLFPNTKLVECTVDGKLMSPAQVHNKVWELVRRIALKDVPPQRG